MRRLHRWQQGESTPAGVLVSLNLSWVTGPFPILSKGFGLRDESLHDFPGGSWTSCLSEDCGPGLRTFSLDLYLLTCGQDPSGWNSPGLTPLNQNRGESLQLGVHVLLPLLPLLQHAGPMGACVQTRSLCAP